VVRHDQPRALLRQTFEPDDLDVEALADRIDHREEAP
jgi:hypothetical protein